MGQSEYSMRKPAYFAGKFVYYIEKSAYIFFGKVVYSMEKPVKFAKKSVYFREKFKHLA